MYHYFATVILTATVAMAWAHNGVVIKVPKLTSAPTIDGDLSDWEEYGWTDGVWDIERVRQQSFSPWIGIQDSGEEPAGTALTAADISGQYFMAWDEAGIYLGVNAIDNVHDVITKDGNEATWYLKDSCSWFFDVHHDADGWFLFPGDHVFSFVADDSYPAGAHWWRRGENTPIAASEVRALGVRGWRYSLSWLETPGPGEHRVKMKSGNSVNYKC